MHDRRTPTPTPQPTPQPTTQHAAATAEATHELTQELTTAAAAPLEIGKFASLIDTPLLPLAAPLLCDVGSDESDMLALGLVPADLTLGAANALDDAFDAFAFGSGGSGGSGSPVTGAAVDDISATFGLARVAPVGFEDDDVHALMPAADVVPMWRAAGPNVAAAAAAAAGTRFAPETSALDTLRHASLLSTEQRSQLAQQRGAAVGAPRTASLAGFEVPPGARLFDAGANARAVFAHNDDDDDDDDARSSTDAGVASDDDDDTREGDDDDGDDDASDASLSGGDDDDEDFVGPRSRATRNARGHPRQRSRSTPRRARRTSPASSAASASSDRATAAANTLVAAAAAAAALPAAAPRISSPGAPRQFATGRWTEEEDARLLEATRVYAGQWKRVSELVGTRSAPQCLHRWRKSVRPGVTRRKRWTPEEDAALRDAVLSVGPQWTKVQELVPGRTDVQCRERWVNILDPSICRAPWSADEDAELRELVTALGIGHWRSVSARMTNMRTDYACRKRWEKLCRSSASSAVTTASASSSSGPSADRTPSPPSFQL